MKRKRQIIALVLLNVVIVVLLGWLIVNINSQNSQANYRNFAIVSSPASSSGDVALLSDTFLHLESLVCATQMSANSTQQRRISKIPDRKMYEPAFFPRNRDIPPGHVVLHLSAAYYSGIRQVLQVGSVVRVLGTDNSDWSLVEAEGGIRGWLPSYLHVALSDE